ncbi:type IV pilus secretin family protein [Crenobacter intestini]|uniref:Type IV pilus biogenesis and competence protein PilQ n=1 Tax=Crenobacter intestini TaxID=2563443 RepID=A0A4T0UWL5_9NEIS|nr:type IV pilus secretin family protein [Crenobacter intestini]TIC83449.1 type IV pilus secretin PilQ [Crenobacter intestini]
MKSTQLTTLAGSLALLGASQLLWAAGNTITGIEVLRNQGGAQELAITLTGPAALPQSFALSNPPRIAFDFAGTASTLKQSQPLPGPLLSGATVVEAGGRSRVVLSLTQAAPYRTRTDGNRVLVSLGGAQAPASVTAPAPAAAPMPAPTIAPLNTRAASGYEVGQIDFRRGADGAGKLVVDLPAGASTDINRSGRALTVSVGAPLPARLARNLDVADFATPVQRVDAAAAGRGSRIVLQNNGEWDYSSYQTDRQLVVEVRKLSREQANAALAAQDKPAYKGDKLSLNFQNVDVRVVLQTLAEFAGFNLVTGDSVSGNVTLVLKNVPWDQALELVLQQKGLAKRQVGNVIRVAPQAEMIEMAKQAAEVRAATTLQEPLVTEIFKIKYRSVEDVMAAVRGLVPIGGGDKDKPQASSQGAQAASAYADAKTNQLIVRDKPQVLSEIRDVLRIIDKPSKQVLIEARIVEARDTFQRDLGVKLGFAKVGGDTSVGSGIGSGNITQPGGGGATLPTPPNVNLPITGATGSLGVIYKGASSIIGLELQASQQQGNSKIISSPRVLTADRTKAIIKEGTEIPYKTVSDNGTETQFKEAALVLEVTPQITPEEELILDIQINKDAPKFLDNLSEPAIDKREVKTQVRIENGGTVVIGGIYVQDQSDTVTKVPLLGDIPVLGHLFRSNGKKSERREMLVFLTPRIIESEALVR